VNDRGEERIAPAPAARPAAAEPFQRMARVRRASNLRRIGYLCRAARRAARMLTRLAAEDRVPYVVAYPVSDDWEIGARFDVARCKGLLFCTVVEDDPPSTSRVLTFWKSKQQYEEQAGVVARELGLGNATPIRAFQRDIRGPGESWGKSLWEKAKLLPSLILWLFGVIGALASLQLFYGFVLAKPDVRVEGADEPRRFVEGEPCATDLRLRNFSRHGSVSVYLEPFKVMDLGNRPTAGFAIDSGNPPAVPPINPGESEVVPIKSSKPAAGEYRIGIGGMSKMGWWRDPEPVKAEVKVRVFKVFGESGRRIELVDGNECWVEFMVEAGKAMTEPRRCDVTVPGGAGVFVRDVRLSQHIDRDSIKLTPQASARKIEWKLSGMAAFDVRPVTVVLESSRSLDRTAWDAIVRGIEFLP
jgi:hypothetical protein